MSATTSEEVVCQARAAAGGAGPRTVRGREPGVRHVAVCQAATTQELRTTTGGLCASRPQKPYRYSYVYAFQRAVAAVFPRSDHLLWRMSLLGHCGLDARPTAAVRVRRNGPVLQGHSCRFGEGLDAGLPTIVWRLQRYHQAVASPATMTRYLTRHALVTRLVQAAEVVLHQDADCISALRSSAFRALRTLNRGSAARCRRIESVRGLAETVAKAPASARRTR